jgi:hypothetical protein
LIATLAGVSFCGGHLAGFLSAGSRYQPLAYNPIHVRLSPQPPFANLPTSSAWDETAGYARLAHEILRLELGGDSLASYQPYALDSLPAPSFWWRDRLGPVALAVLARLAGGMPAAFVLADFLFAAVLAWALFRFAWLLRSEVPFATLATALVLWFNWYDLLGSVYVATSGVAIAPPIFSRTPYPQLSSALFVLFLICFVKMRGSGTAGSAARLGGSLVLNLYTYFYSWTFAAAMLAATLGCGWSGLDREWRRGGLQRLLAAAGCAGLLAWPVWSHLVGSSEVAEDLFRRGAGVLTHRPDLSRGLPCLLFLILSLVLLARRSWRRAWIWTAFWFAALASLNQQVVSGRALQPDHYLAYFIEPFALVFLLDLGWEILDRAARPAVRDVWQRAQGPLAVGVLLAGSAQGFYKLWQGFREARAYHVWDPPFRELVDLLQRPALRSYGLLTNDRYLYDILPGFAIQKPLRPRAESSALTDAEISALIRATEELWGEQGAASSQPEGPRVRSDPRKVLVVMNRHRPSPGDPAACQPLLQNRDFTVSLRSACRW